MGIPLIPPALAGAYGLALGNIAGRHVWRQWMDPRRNSQLENYNHVTGRSSRTSSGGEYINPSGAQTSTAQTMKRSRSYTKTSRKKRGRRGGRRRLRRITNLWPPMTLVKFRQVMQTQSSPSTPGVGTTILNVAANSLADAFGGGGSQLPLGLDQWAAMYQKYCVVSSRCYVKAHNLTSTGSVTLGLTLREPLNNNNLGSGEYYLETPMTVSKIMSPDLDHTGLGSSFRAKKYWHVKKFMDAEDLHGALSTTPGAPSKYCYYQIWHTDTNNTETYTLELWVTIEFTCLLFDRVLPSRSSL